MNSDFLTYKKCSRLPYCIDFSSKQKFQPSCTFSKLKLFSQNERFMLDEMTSSEKLQKLPYTICVICGFPYSKNLAVFEAFHYR